MCCFSVTLDIEIPHLILIMLTVEIHVGERDYKLKFSMYKKGGTSEIRKAYIKHTVIIIATVSI